MKKAYREQINRHLQMALEITEKALNESKNRSKEEEKLFLLRDRIATTHLYLDVVWGE